MRGRRRRPIVSAKGVRPVTLNHKDIAATGLTVLVLILFASTHEGWGVPLVGSSHRWAAGAILLLGIMTCALGSPGKGAAARLSAILGTIALALAVVSIATASLTPLSLLVADIVVLWVVATFGHVRHERHRPIVA
jgi:hypothetical protein